MRGGAFDKESLINSMANIDIFVTDNSPVVDKFFKYTMKNILLEK